MGGVFPKPTPPPPFDLTTPRFDQSTFEGRWMSFQQSTNFMTLILSKERINKSLSMLEDYRRLQQQDQQQTCGHSTDDLWEARRVVEATCHPETREMITPLFRFAAFAPANVPICTLLVWPNPSPALAMFGQWVNQSYNVAVNYSNRNMSNPMPTSVVASSYALATLTSCGIAVGMGRIMAKRASKLTPFTRSFGPWAAVVASGCVNVAFVRWNEMVDGIEVESEDGEQSYGQSVVAGQSAIAKCCAARAIWTTPIIAGVPFLVAPLARIFPSPRGRMLSEVLVLAGMLWAVMPAALAVFPQRDSMAVENLEPEVQKRIPAGVSRVFYNKGL